MDAIVRSQLETQLREARRAEIATRLSRHDDNVRRMTSGNRRQAGRKLPLDFLAIGDSWFDYPLTNDGLLTPINQGIVGVQGFQLQSIGNPPPLILSFALHGQSSTTMLTYENQQKILNALTDPNTTRWNNGTTADGILVSVGGDDIVGDSFIIYLDYNGGGLDKTRLDGVLDSIIASYLDLFALRDLAAAELNIDPKDIPIFGHCYDYALPNGRPAGWPIPLSGPWLKPSLDFAACSSDQDLAIVAAVIDEFYNRLTELKDDPKNNFILIDTRKTLTRDTTQPNGWANEIHPYTEGFKALAGKFLGALRNHYPPGRI
jgi:hypothetical protein